MRLTREIVGGGFLLAIGFAGVMAFALVTRSSDSGSPPGASSSLMSGALKGRAGYVFVPEAVPKGMASRELAMAVAGDVVFGEAFASHPPPGLGGTATFGVFSDRRYHALPAWVVTFSPSAVQPVVPAGMFRDRPPVSLNRTTSVIMAGTDGAVLERRSPGICCQTG